MGLHPQPCVTWLDCAGEAKKKSWYTSQRTPLNCHVPTLVVYPPHITFYAALVRNNVGLGLLGSSAPRPHGAQSNSCSRRAHSDASPSQLVRMNCKGAWPCMYARACRQLRLSPSTHILPQTSRDGSAFVVLRWKRIAARPLLCAIGVEMSANGTGDTWRTVGTCLVCVDTTEFGADVVTPGTLRLMRLSEQRKFVVGRRAGIKFRSALGYMARYSVILLLQCILEIEVRRLGFCEGVDLESWDQTERFGSGSRVSRAA